MNKWEKAQMERWIPWYKNSWGYHVYKQYDRELNTLLVSQLYASSFVYHTLGSSGTQWNSLVKDFLYPSATNKKITIKQWSDSYNLSFNWMRLSLLMSMCSYFETYLACVIKESIESDPGLIFGCSHTIDGMLLKKKDIIIKKSEIDEIIKNCTKGDWNSRISKIESLFGSIPSVFKSSISDLEKMRRLRNNMGHAFGRDIEKAQNYASCKIQPMESLDVEPFNKYRFLIHELIKQLDIQLMTNHIGNFEPLLHYHNIYNVIKHLNKGPRMIALKKSLGNEVSTLISKDQCRAIIKYYDGL